MGYVNSNWVVKTGEQWKFDQGQEENNYYLQRILGNWDQPGPTAV